MLLRGACNPIAIPSRSTWAGAGWQNSKVVVSFERLSRQARCYSHDKSPSPSSPSVKVDGAAHAPTSTSTLSNNSSDGEQDNAKAEPEAPGLLDTQFVLSVMPLATAKLPTDLIPLQLFEPRYRLMFRLINQKRGRERLFGVVQADRQQGTMESVGALCEMVTFVPVPEQRRIFVFARVVGRFRVHRVVSDTPFVTVVASRLADETPDEAVGALQHAAVEARVWQAMQDVRALAAKLYGHMGELGDDTFSVEVRRWCPDPSVLRNGDLPLMDPAMLDAVEALGMVRPLPPQQPSSHNPSSADLPLSSGEGFRASKLPANWQGRHLDPAPGTPQGGQPSTSHPLSQPLPGRDFAEQLAADGRSAVSDAVRRERFSFAALRSCVELPEHELQAMLYCTNTVERLRRVEAALLDGRGYLAARSALRDVF